MFKAAELHEVKEEYDTQSGKPEAPADQSEDSIDMEMRRFEKKM